MATLKSVQAAALRLLRAEVIDQPVLNNWDRLMAYLNAELARERVEQFRVLFLDNRNRLLADEAQQRGTVNHTPVYPREVVEARAGTARDGADPGAQPPERRSDAIARRHRDDPADQGGGGGAVDRAA